MTRLYGSLLILLLTIAFWPPTVTHAQCRAYAAAQTYVEKDVMGHLDCDLNGHLRVTGGGTATAAAPTLSEGAAAGFSFDLAGNVRFTPGTLISGEDQANNLLMTSGGVVRIATLGSVTSQAATSIPAIIPTGAKALMGQIINATSETKAVTAIVYGNWTNSTTGGIEICQIELPSTVTTLQLQGLCPISVNAIPFNWWYYKTPVYTSTSLAPFTIWPMF